MFLDSIICLVFFTHEPSHSLIAAATPFNDIRVTVKFRKAAELLTWDFVTSKTYLDTAVMGLYPTTQDVSPVYPATFKLPAAVNNVVTGQGALDVYAMSSVAPNDPAVNTIMSNITLTDVQLFAHYALISTPDRNAISDETEIDQVIDQWLYVPKQPWSPSTNATKDVELRLASSVRAIFFGVRNTTFPTEWSNYSTHHTEALNNGLIRPFVLFEPFQAQDPIKTATLRYEVSDRWVCEADYCSLVAPFYFCQSIPTDIGLHVISYAIHLGTTGAYGSSNFGRLTSVVLTLEASAMAIANNSSSRQASQKKLSTFETNVIASAVNLWRSSGGAGGYPLQ